MTSPTALCNDTYHHIFNRGANREDIFREKCNYIHFLSLYARNIEPVADTYAYCLLRNHFHLLIRIKAEDEIDTKTLKISETFRLSTQFSDFFNAVAKSINIEYQQTGSLFQHPFGRILITNQTQLTQAVIYIHQNPQKHQLVIDFRTWKYSSFVGMLSSALTHLKRDEVIEWFDSRDHFVRTHDEINNPKDHKDP